MSRINVGNSSREAMRENTLRVDFRELGASASGVAFTLPSN